MMQFVLTSLRPEIPTYGAIRGQYSFVITLIEGWFHATAKKTGGKAFDRTRVELGYYHHFQDAQDACEKYFWKHSQ
jgi:hypothetical protein